MKHKFTLSIGLSTQSQNKITKAILPLRREYPGFYWIEKSNYYINLYNYNFSSPFPKIKEQFERILFKYDSFYLYASEFGAFINGKKVLYLGFYKQKELDSIVKDVRIFF